MPGATASDVPVRYSKIVPAGLRKFSEISNYEPAIYMHFHVHAWAYVMG